MPRSKDSTSSDTYYIAIQYSNLSNIHSKASTLSLCKTLQLLLLQSLCRAKLRTEDLLQQSCHLLSWSRDCHRSLLSPLSILLLIKFVEDPPSEVQQHETQTSYVIRVLVFNTLIKKSPLSFFWVIVVTWQFLSNFCNFIVFLILIILQSVPHSLPHQEPLYYILQLWWFFTVLIVLTISTRWVAQIIGMRRTSGSRWPNSF